MVSSGRHQKESSFFTDTKSVKALGYFIVFFFLSSCQTSQTPVLSPDTPEAYLPPKTTQLTKMGSNRQPSYSPSGKKILFTSAQREEHNNRQVYLLDFKTGLEKRLSFQNGETSSPLFYRGDKKVIYLSTTDFEKEHPPIIYKSKNDGLKWPAYFFHDSYDIYTSTVSGSNIRRITKTERPENYISPAYKKNEFAYLLQGRSFNYLKVVNTLGRKKPNIRKTRKLILFPTKKSKTLLWVEADNDFKKWSVLSKTRRGRVKTLISNSDFHFQSLGWHPTLNGFIYSSNKDNPKNSELYFYSIRYNCHQRLTYWKSQELDPSFSPDGEKILYSSNKSGSFHIYEMPSEVIETCQSIPSGDKLNK